MDVRPIDANALMDNLDENCGDLDLQYNSEYAKLVHYIESQPVLDYVPIKHGYWKKCGQLSRTQWLHRCSLCGCPQDYAHNYCPNCGARMDGEK